jgi:hypothetical protein
MMNMGRAVIEDGGKQIHKNEKIFKLFSIILSIMQVSVIATASPRLLPTTMNSRNSRQIVAKSHRLHIQRMIRDIHIDIDKLYDELLPLQTDVDIDMVCYTDEYGELLCSQKKQ